VASFAFEGNDATRTERRGIRHEKYLHKKRYGHHNDDVQLQLTAKGIPRSILIWRR